MIYKRILARLSLLVGVVSLSALIASACVPSLEPPTQGLAVHSSTHTSTPIVNPSSTPTKIPIVHATSTPERSCRQAKGRVETITYPGFVLQEEIPVRVYLPPCYDQANRSFPVVYLLHGYPMDETHWDGLGVDEMAEVKIRYGFWPPLLIVMPRQPLPIFTASDGGPGSYESELVDGLLPFIDREFRTQLLPGARAIAGVSRGAVWALEISFRHPNLFNTVAALSPALHVNYARPPYDPFVIVQDGNPLPNWIFLSAGDEEEPFREATEKLSQTLLEAHVAHTLVIGSGGHNDEAWKAVIGEMMDYVVGYGFADQKRDWRWDSPINRFQVQ